LSDLDSIIGQLDIPQWFEINGLTIANRKGKSWKCLCPFCKDPTHFGLDPKTGLWKCYKCSRSGNAITFYAKLKNVKNGEAVKAIKKHLGIEDEPKKPARKSTKKKKEEEAPPPKPVEQPEKVKQIYERFFTLLPLTDKHRETFKVKRGYTDEIIDALRFRSGGKHIAAIIEKLREEFAQEDLLNSGLLKKVNKSAVIEDQLLQDIPLIPYVDEKGAIYHVRPHKLGFEGFSTQIYCPYLLQGRQSSHVIYTEGEFKAAALYQWGIPGVAAPGISSFGKNNFDRLVNFLRKHGVEKVTVMFDNEKKDDPSLPNFKPRIDARYDTQFWAYIAAYKLNQAGIDANIANLPDSWRVNGKIDFDGALAQGHTREEIITAMEAGVPPEDYLDSLPEEALRIVRRKKAKFFSEDLPIRREFYKYVVTRTSRSGEKYEQFISNFVINITSSFFTPSGVVRNVVLVNEYGEKSDPFTLDPGDMAGVDSFKKFCFGKGNYIFEGRAEDLILIWKYEFLRDTGEIIYMPEKIGFLGNGLWLFGNMAIKNGEAIPPHSDGIVWLNGKGYKPQSMQIGSAGEAVEDAIPSLYEHDVDIRDIATKLYETVGGYEAYVAIGWVAGTIFSKEIFERYKIFPILFPHGKRESGKSTFMRWIQAFFGVESEGITIGGTTTANFIARVLSYYSSLGVWFDEYRNEIKVTQKDGFFRSAYNRQLSGKGTATAFQTRGFTVNSTVAISGEELPKDNGLFTRCIPLQISTNKRKSAGGSHFEWINKHCRRFSGFVRHLIINHEQYLPKVLNNIAKTKGLLVQLDISDRTAENWAICAGAFEATVMEDDCFLDWVIDTCQEIRRTGENEHMLNQFWDDVNYLQSEGQLGNRFLKVSGERLHVWFKGVYETWSIHYRKKTGREPFDKMSIMQYLRDEPYFVSNTENTWMDQATRRTVSIDLNKATETILEIADNVKTRTLPGTD
jgi:ribosomal protein L37AE/L43A